jgi:hypothetical protein
VAFKEKLGHQAYQVLIDPQGLMERKEVLGNPDQKGLW